MMWFFNLVLYMVFHLIPVRVLDELINSSLPDSKRSLKKFSKINSSLFEYISRKKAILLFKKASRMVPAYKTFLQKHQIDPCRVKMIEDFDHLVPQTSKENYVRAYPITERCTNGKIPFRGYLEESAGTSGNPTLWIKSFDEEKDSSLRKATMKYLYGFNNENDERYIILNALMIGGWTGGLRFASRIGSFGTVMNTGPNPQKIISCMKELGTGFTYLIGGYPPFMIELVEYGSKLKDFDWTSYTIHIFTGGEGFVEEWREYISSRLKKGVIIYSDYGAIDLDVGISMETPFTVAIRKLIKSDIRLRKDILSSERLPSFVGQYSPQRFYIRNITNNDGIREVEISVLKLKSASPKIKYIIGDEGGIISFHDICEILESRGYSIARIKKEFNVSIVIPFPLIYIYGRSDGTVTINGAIISPSEIYEAILSDSELVSTIHAFKLSVESDTDNFIRLYVYLEMNKNMQISPLWIKKSHDTIRSKLLESNECFRINYNKNPAAGEPVIKTFSYQTGIFANKSSSVKNIYFK